jgi:ribosomal protein S18 acetylase RimI-like enzyme
VNVKVRKARNDEIPEVCKLISAIFPRSGGTIKAEDVIFVAEQGGQLVGFVRYTPKTDKITLNGLGILSEYRGGGIGKLLLEESLDEMKKSGKPIYLKVKATNDPALNLYLKQGFFQRRYGDVLVMVKQPDN